MQDHECRRIAAPARPGAEPACYFVCFGICDGIRKKLTTVMSGVAGHEPEELVRPVAAATCRDTADATIGLQHGADSRDGLGHAHAEPRISVG